MARLHLVISTHTTLHLRRTLLGAASQGQQADSTTVSCDNDAGDIVAVVQGAAREFGTPVAVVQRPFQGTSRSAQVRNNAVRFLLRQGANPSDTLVFLDGDCCPGAGMLAAHRALGGAGRVVIGFRIDLTPEQTAAFDEGALAAGGEPARPTEGQMRALAARDRRYRRHALLRRFGLVKAHKPKLLSANFSLTLDAYTAVNGFDERYTGYGQEDDDLGRRLYRAGVRPVIGVTRAVVYHSYHPTRAPGAWEESPNAARFAESYQAAARRGLSNPLEQPEPRCTVFDARGNLSPGESPGPCLPPRRAR